MVKVEVDFDVFKELTYRRTSEEETASDVIRKLLKLPSPEKTANTNEKKDRPWIAGGVQFPNGTEFKAAYKGQSYKAVVENGALVFNGKRYYSPSSAAMAITITNINGWRFWYCSRPGEDKWRLISNLRS